MDFFMICRAWRGDRIHQSFARIQAEVALFPMEVDDGSGMDASDGTSACLARASFFVMRKIWKSETYDRGAEFLRSCGRVVVL